MSEPVEVALCPQSPEFADHVLRWRNDPEVTCGLFSSKPPTPHEHLAWLASLGQDRREFVILVLPARLPVGTIGLSHIDRANGHAEYGVLIGEKTFWGKGVACAASEQILAIAFHELNLHKVHLRVFADNARAIGLYERLGFLREGVLCEHMKKDGRYRDVVCMGLLASAWRSGSA